MNELNLNIPKKLIPIYSSKAKYKVLYGGRGGGKSWSFSDLAIIRGYEKKLSFVCLRQFQSSIKDSVHRLLSNSISKMGLDSFFEIQDNRITGQNGTEYVFKGLARNINNIKSFEGADIAWVTEAVDMSSEAWEKLDPTIRKDDSEIWIDFNPEEEEDPIYQTFIIKTPKDSLVIKINYDENPFFPKVLKEKMEHCKEYNPDDFDNIWLGECKKMSEAQILRNKWEIKEFDTPEDAKFNYGSDWGNTGTADPDVIVRCYDVDGYLYIDEEAYSHVQKIEDYTEFYDSMKGSRENNIICDSTMEKFRKYLIDRGFYLSNARKGAGSIDAGIKYLRSFKRIYVHPRCKKTIFEFKNYKYKTDPKTGEIINIIIDKHNHIIDSLRYALEKYGPNKGRITKTTGW